jgi:hypothetical protein
VSSERFGLSRPRLAPAVEDDADDADDADDRLGRVTVSTVRSLDGLQQYVVELDRRAGAEQGRLIVAAVVCLQVVRRWIDGSGGSPA